MNASPGLNPTKSMRVLIATLCTLLGVVVGLIGDLVGGLESPGSKILGALMLSPLLVTVGGFSVTVPGLRWAFFIGGLVFWPVYFFSVWRWFRRPTWRGALFLTVWTAQGYFQLLHRMAVVMSA
ncbi:hypothetical protein [Hyalangium gracile]|uniref:hypothetical protein n=1 Tax=Hyalangium gracile TaxID=394092 RepID=UPI001CCB4E4B|nr:hypothetical protein [Hyalangium gracile]